ncbi:MAG: hypothetical protein WCT04_23060 [Planctomycetota bacterium]
MEIAAGQIYFLRKGATVGYADYGRPCLVLRASKASAAVCYFSTKMDYVEPGDVAIYPADADFKASGLRDASYIVPDLIDNVMLNVFEGAKLLGRATGDFKANVEDWYGAPLL